MGDEDESSRLLQQEQQDDEVEEEKTKPSLLFMDISPDKNGGITKTIVKPGTGEDNPPKGSKVYVHYVGRLENGEKFDSSRDRGDVFEFKLGEGNVIKGWDVGVATMLLGETCELKIAAEYAYGEHGSPPKIPGGATLIFEIELLMWDDEDVTGDGGVRKRMIKEGVTGGGKPNFEGQVKLHIRGTHKGELFDERDVEYLLGDGGDINIPEGVEKGVRTMKRYEKAKFFIKSKYFFKGNGHEEFGVPPDADELVYEVVLFDFERVKEIYEMTYDEKVEKSKDLKERGLQCIKKGDHPRAIEYYERILKYVATTKDETDFHEGLPFRIAANLNAALCYLKIKDFTKAKVKAENATKLDPQNVKGHFRLGEAYIGLKYYENAVAAFNSALKVEPGNTAAQKQLGVAKGLLKKQTEKEKKLYSSIFANMSATES